MARFWVSILRRTSASMASSAFISDSMRRKISPRISCGSAKNSTSSSWFRWSRTRWERWTIFSRESLIGWAPSHRMMPFSLASLRFTILNISV